MGSSVLAVATQIMAMSIITAFILLFIGFGFLVLLHVCIVGKVFTRGLRDELRNERRNGLDPDVLEKLPCFEFINGGEVNDCVVCLERFEEGERCRLLPNCGHSFHAHCVDSWLVVNPCCPICRARAWEKNGMPVVGFNASS